MFTDLNYMNTHSTKIPQNKWILKELNGLTWASFGSKASLTWTDPSVHISNMSWNSQWWRILPPPRTSSILDHLCYRNGHWRSLCISYSFSFVSFQNTYQKAQYYLHRNIIEMSTIIRAMGFNPQEYKRVLGATRFDIFTEVKIMSRSSCLWHLIDW
jgi:hypothetical protein